MDVNEQSAAWSLARWVVAQNRGWIAIWERENGNELLAAHSADRAIRALREVLPNSPIVSDNSGMVLVSTRQVVEAFVRAVVAAHGLDWWRQMCKAVKADYDATVIDLGGGWSVDSARGVHHTQAVPPLRPDLPDVVQIKER